jgi:hypothetical protein
MTRIFMEVQDEVPPEQNEHIADSCQEDIIIYA